MAETDTVYVVTGAVGSLGTAISTQLARTGGTVVLVVRDERKAQPARDELARVTGNDRVETLGCDFAALRSVRTAAVTLKARHPKVHVLVNTAAAFSASRQTTADGFELQMGVNHLGHFLFTLLLEDALVASGAGRVVVLGMPAKNPILLDDLMLERRYDGVTAHGMSKAANLSFTRELAERWRGKVTANAVHPGLVKTTLLGEAPLPLRLVFALLAAPPETGAATPVYVATAPELRGVTGQFFVKRKPCPFPPGTDDVDARRRLWAMSECLVGLRARA